MIIIDISRPFQKHPGMIKAPFKNKISYRVWWMWFAVTWCNMSDDEYLSHIASGATEWVTKKGGKK